jgi:hypothetical protein
VVLTSDVFPPRREACSTPLQDAQVQLFSCLCLALPDEEREMAIEGERGAKIKAEREGRADR